MINQKLVCIKNKKSGHVHRLPKFLAKEAVESQAETIKGVFTYTSKSAAKKSHKREEKAKRIGAMINMKTKAGKKFIQADIGERTYIREYIGNDFIGAIYGGRILVKTKSSQN